MASLFREICSISLGICTFALMFQQILSMTVVDFLEENFKGHLDYMVLVCPTFSWNKMFQSWGYKIDPDLL